MTDTGPHQFKMEKWISCAPFERLLKLKIVEADNGRAVLTMPFTKDMAQGAGLMHGGALVSLADTAVVMAIKSMIPPQTHFATITLESRFLHPVKKGMVTAKAHVGERDGRLFNGHASVYDDEDREVMQFTSVFKIAKDAQIKGIRFADADSGE